jgi:hypothetical protein
MTKGHEMRHGKNDDEMEVSETLVVARVYGITTQIPSRLRQALCQVVGKNGGD